MLISRSLAPSSGQTRFATANRINTTAPTSVTERTEIFVASIRPPITAIAVQQAWPSVAPMETAIGSSFAPSAIVAICDRSPHSARKVSVNAFRVR